MTIRNSPMIRITSAIVFAMVLTACGNQSGAQNEEGQNNKGIQNSAPETGPPPKAQDEKPVKKEGDRLPADITGQWRFARLYFSHGQGQEKLDQNMVDAFAKAQANNSYVFRKDGSFEMELGGKSQMKGKWERKNDSLLMLTQIQVRMKGQPWPGQPNSKPDMLILQPSPEGKLRYSSKKKNVIFELKKQENQ